MAARRIRAGPLDRNKLTLSLGMRYEYYPLMSRADRGLEVLDLTQTLPFAGAARPQPVLLLGGLGGNPDDLGIKISRTLLDRDSELPTASTTIRYFELGGAARSTHYHGPGRCAASTRSRSVRASSGRTRFSPFGASRKEFLRSRDPT